MYILYAIYTRGLFLIVIINILILQYIWKTFRR